MKCCAIWQLECGERFNQARWNKSHDLRGKQSSKRGKGTSKSGSSKRLCSGMIIVRLGGVAVRGSDDVVRLLGNDGIEAETPVIVIAGGEIRTITIVPVER